MPQFSDQNDSHSVLGRRGRESAFHLGPRKRAYVMVACAHVGADQNTAHRQIPLFTMAAISAVPFTLCAVCTRSSPMAFYMK